jgi:hypothetical protein
MCSIAKGLTFANSGFIIYIFVVNTVIFSLVRFRVGEKFNKAQPGSLYYSRRKDKKDDR